jgi:RHS repeat-associated protein
VTDTSKNIVTAITYHPYGETNVKEGTKSYFYTEKEQDSTELYYFVGRYYDPCLGRFMTRDSEFGYMNRPQTLNRYTYVLNNPLKFVDPDGHDVWKPSWGQRGENKKKSTASALLEMLTIAIGLLSLMLFLPCFGPMAAAGSLLFVGKLSLVFGCLSVAFGILSIMLSEREDFANALGDYLDDQGYKLKDIEKIEGSAEEGMLVLNFSDGKTVTFKKTIWGWEVVEESEDCESSGGDENSDDFSSDSPHHNAYPTVRV